MANDLEYGRKPARRHAMLFLWLSVACVLLAVYVVGYNTARAVRRPMANMAYYRYTYDSNIDAFCYWAFLPLRKLDEYLNPTPLQHMDDRVYGPPIEGP